MELIFVRHGQTGENVAHRHQPNNTPLSPEGRVQAKEIVQSLKKWQPTHIVTSPFVRTLETASITGNELGIIPSIAHSLRELERPRHITGHQHLSIRSILFYVGWYTGITKTGESYRQLRNRITLAQSELAQLPADARVVIFSHSVYINMFLAHKCQKRPLSPFGAFCAFRRMFKMKNTGTVELSYNPQEKDSKKCVWYHRKST